MRPRSALVLPALAAALVATLLGCNKNTPPAGTAPDDPKAAGGSAAGTSRDDPNANVGSPLFAVKKVAEFPPPRFGGDAIVIPGMTVQYDERQQISAEVDGKIDLIATPMTWDEAKKVYVFQLRDGGDAVVTHDPAAFAAPTFDPKTLHPNIVFNPRHQAVYPDRTGGKPTPENRAKWLPYWKLSEGDRVLAGQELCILDDSMIVTERDSAKKMKDAAARGAAEAKRGLEATEKKIKLYEKSAGVISPREQLEDLTMLARFAENLASSDSATAKAEAEYDKANVMLRRHHITSRVEGIIRNVAKRPGEYVRPGEKIFEIQSTERVRLEGYVDVSYYDRVLKAKRANQAVTVEPAVPSPPVRTHPSPHNLEVTGVAVTGDPARPLVVSVGMDGKALVWEPNLADPDKGTSFPRNLLHPVAVRAVACTPPGVKPVVAVTGADDGKVRIWDVSDPAKLPNAAREPADAHASGVTAVAVSPDGRFAATAAGREVFVWDLVAGKKLYALPAEHRDTVTSVAFTPESKLVTAARDRTLKVWRLGTERAAVARTVEHRAGTVDVPGMSPDGGRVLFDQDKGRLDLVNLADGQTVGQLANVGPGVAFAGLGLFAPEYGTMPDRYTIVTAGDGDLKGGLQVWQVPKAGGRGAEIARLVTPGRVGVTCAAFSPHKDARFLVVGTAAGTVHVWTPPTGPTEKLTGRITVIDATDPRYLTVRVELPNPGLLDRSAATVIINPGQ